MVRFGIAGFGLHAVKRLMPGFALSRHCKVTALSRRDPQKAEQSARQFRIPRFFTSTAELCACPEVDAVLVTSPNVTHLEDVLAAVGARKPVLCEKPMAMNAEECRRTVEAARRAGVLLGVAHCFRFEESTNRLRERVAAGEIGTPLFVRSEFCFMGGPAHGRVWLNDPAVAGGGPIPDVGVHCIDTLCYILQDEIVRVSARGLPNPRVPGIEAAAALTLEFSRGTLGAVFCSFIADYRTPLELVGSTGVLRAEDCLNVEKPILLELRRDGKTVESETVSNTQVYALQADAFAAAVEGKAAFPIPGEDGWRNQEILDAAYRSLKTAKVEDVRKIPSS